MTLRSWTRKLFGRPVTRPIRKALAQNRLRVEELEPRVMLATQVFNVTTMADEISSNSQLSLREAILQANAAPASDDVVINLQPGQAYSIGADRDRFQNSLQPSDSESFSAFDPYYGDFDIRRAMTINGNGASVSAAGHGRVFDIHADSGTVTLNNLTALDGRGHIQGGGVYAAGALTLALNNVTISANQTDISDSAGGGLYAEFTSSGQLIMSGGKVATNQVWGRAGSAGEGGGIYVEGGQVTITGTEFLGNTAYGRNATADQAEGGFARGGGLYARGVSRLTISGATFDNNSAQAGQGGSFGSAGGRAYGGAIYSVNISGIVDISETQFTGNRAYAGSGGNAGEGPVGDGGAGYGGAVAIDTFFSPFGPTTVAATIERSLFSDNLVQGGPGTPPEGYGIDGGDGGEAFGGAIAFGISTPITDATQLTVRDTKFDGNSAIGGAGADGFHPDAIFNVGSSNGGRGGDAFGGGVFAGIGTQTFTNSPFLENKAVAGDGGRFKRGTGGRGGDAKGGAIYTSQNASSTTITGHLSEVGPSGDPSQLTGLGMMFGNQAIAGSGGGTGGIFPSADADNLTGQGGDASGGAIASRVLSLHIEEILFLDNGAFSGNGGHSDRAAGGSNGTARGGAVFAISHTTLTNAAFNHNLAAGGRLGSADAAALAGAAGGRSEDGDGFHGGNGGNAYGGAAYILSGNLTVTGSGFTLNQALAGLGGAGGSAADHGVGGDGGAGGNAAGGALRVETAGTVQLSSSAFIANYVQGGRGGSGGEGGDGNPRGLPGGSAGAGGSASGGGVSIAALFAAPTATLSVLYVRGNTVIAGDGGFAGNGGGGAEFGGGGGQGGRGGDASGGGIQVENANTTIDRSTVEQNVVSSGFGAAGGYGGAGSWGGGNGGAGGSGGLAAGGGIVRRDGTLSVSTSTVVQNKVVSGFGGHGGFAGPGGIDGGSGGNGGNGGDARGGGIYSSDFSSQPVSLRTSTVAQNVVDAGAGGFGAPQGVLLEQAQAFHPIRYEYPPPGIIIIGQPSPPQVYGAARVLYNGFQGPTGGLVGNLQFHSTSALVSLGVDNLDAGGFAIADEVGLVLTTSGFGASLGVGAAIGIATSFTVITEIAAAAGVFSAEVPVGVVFSAGAALGTTGFVTAGVAVLAIGVAVLAKGIVGGALTGDWEGSFENGLGSPGVTYPANFGLLLSGLQPPADNDPPDVPDSSAGAGGHNGTAEGTGVWASTTAERSLISDNQAFQRFWSRQFDGFLSFDVRETVTEVARQDVRTLFSQGHNFIGAIDSGHTGATGSDISGTTTSPLSARPDTQTRFNGGPLPTLKLLAGSPARYVVPVAGPSISQNDFSWSIKADIGAWGGPSNRAPAGVADTFTANEDDGIFIEPGQLLANDTDPDLDPVEIVGINDNVTDPSTGESLLHGTLTPLYTQIFGTNEIVLVGVGYSPAPGFSGQAKFSYDITDGELFSRNVVVTVNVLPVNDAPIAENGAATTAEENAVDVDLRTLVTDEDTPIELLQFSVSAANHGSVALLADGHTARFTPANNFNGPASFNYTVIDEGNGVGPTQLVGPKTVAVTVTPVNDAPVNTLPASQTVDEDHVLSIRGLSVSDVDLAEGTNTMKVTLSVEHGTLSLAQTTGLTFDEGDGTDDPTVTFSGSKAALDAAFAELAYTPLANFNGTDHLHVLTDDLGNFGAGGPLTDSDTLDIIVNAVNDAPTLTVPGAQTGYEDIRLGLTGLSVADIDLTPTAGLVEVTIGVGAGTLRLGQTSGLTFITGGNDTRSMTFRGTLEAVNSALAGLSYLADLNYSGADTLAILVNDLGNIGTGGLLTASSTVAITVKSAAQQAADLQAQVTALQTTGVLNKAQANALNVKLNLQGNDGDAGKVQAFLNEVAAYLNAGILTQAQADALLGPGNVLLLSVTRR